jgi:hypothetical protein
MVTESPAEAIRITVLVTTELDRLGVAYVVAGSLASSLHGLPRSTNDVDIVAALRAEHASPLAAALASAFYVDADMIRDAVARRSEFNVIHLATMFKVDVFVPTLDGVSRDELARGTTVQVDAEHGVTLRVASPEDTVAQKLHWYRRGGEVSERQWLDVLGVLGVQGDKIDLVYLRATADVLDVGDLLTRALAAVSTPPASNSP